MNGIATTASSLLPRFGRLMIACTLLLFCLAAVPSRGMTDVYQLAQRTGGVATDMTGSTQIFGPGASYTSATSSYAIGFTFYFDKVAYSTFSVNTSGLMSLGKNTYQYPYSHYWPNYSSLTSYYPLIAAYYAYYAAPKSSVGKVHYKLTGTAPNRVLTVEWKDVYSFYGTSTSYPGGTWQIRLYEGSNVIEFWYGSFYTSTNYYYYNIGIAQSSTRYINVWGNNLTSQYYLYPSGSYYNYRYPQNYPITSGTIFEFAPCDKSLSGLVGNVAEGGTTGMKNGDNLLTDKEVMRGNTTGFRPFSFDLPPSPCGAWTYSATFSGPGAADYEIVPGNGTVITEGMTPTINFTPRGVGERQATMTLSLSNGEKFTYTLKGKGVSRMGRIGDVAEGGTNGMSDKDALLTNIEVPRGSSRDVRPFRITNINTTPTNMSLQNATVSFTLDDPNGQYAIRLDNPTGSEKGSSVQAVTTVSTVLSPGGSITPIITFSPTVQGSGRGSGPQPATLTMNADGEIFVYTLSGYSVAPAAEFYFNDQRLIGSTRRLFVNEITCTGEQAVAGSFVIENTNKVPMTIHKVDVWMTEHAVRQGTPPYPQELDSYGELISMNDYFISENSSIAPIPANQVVRFPLTIQPGERKTYYLGFVSQRPGKRYARMFLHTDAVNFVGKEVGAYLPNPVNMPDEEGIMAIDMFGSGLGSHLAKNAEGEQKGFALLFNEVTVGKSVTAETQIYNTGDCDMRISKGDIRLVAGDINDFELLEVLPNTAVDARGDFILAPGASDKITARFTPSRSGSRRASVMLKTNDSTLVIEGVTDRGVYSLDLYGVGRAYIEARPLMLAPAVIDGPGSKGVVKVSNASTEIVTITQVGLTGPNTAEITADPSNPWPSMPFRVMPGQTVEFGVMLNAASGSQPGPRSASLDLTLLSGDPVNAQISGIVGTRTIVANPAAMFRNTMVPVGSFKREYAVLTNAGTFPIHIDQVTVVGPAKEEYSITVLGHSDLDPGASQFIEVVYSPTIAESSNARIEIMSNATNGVQYIDLAGIATGTGSISNPSATGTLLNPGLSAGRTVAGEGLTVASVVPNPVQDKVTISWSLASGGMTEIAIYDLSGRVVRTLQNRYEERGSYTTQADISDLASGTYYVVLRQDGQATHHSVVVVD